MKMSIWKTQCNVEEFSGERVITHVCQGPALEALPNFDLLPAGWGPASLLSGINKTFKGCISIILTCHKHIITKDELRAPHNPDF